MTQSTKRFCAAATLLLAATALACGKKETASTDTAAIAATGSPAPAPAALTISEIQLGKAIGADKKVTNQTDTFGVRDTVYAAVVTNGASTGGKITARWTYNGPNVVSETSQNVTTSGGESVTEFHISKRSPWQKGSYRVEILLDGNAAGSKDFQIK